jgi:predicted NAD/FAD-binding protein
MVPVDSGFIVHNERTYPLLCRLLSELGVETRPTEMSLSIRCEGCGLEYAGAKGLRGVFAQPRSVVNPAFLHLLAQIRRFHRQARHVVATERDDETSLEAFLLRGGYTRYFSSHFVVPLVACVWSVGAGTALRYPVRSLFTFLDNHGMLSVSGSPTWRTIVGGSRTYVDRVVKNLSTVATSTPVRAVIPRTEGAEVRTDDDQGVFYDRVVVAGHADEALAILTNPTPLQRSVLGAFRYSHNDTVLHTDATVLPSSSRAQAAWNFVKAACFDATDHVVVSYDMNRLQGIASTRPHIVTLNASDRIDPAKVLARMTYEHPIYTASSVKAQRHLARLNGSRLAFAGAYHGWGFHEDGCRSGIAAAESLGVTW